MSREVAYKIFHSEVTRWFMDRGDYNLRLAYELKEDSLVYDIGGYLGDFASDIFSQHLCRVKIFEPVPDHAEYIKNRFTKNKKVEVFDFGLSSENTFGLISNASESSSLYDGEKLLTVPLVSLQEFMESQNDTVDLMKINIEGGEYDLLENTPMDVLSKTKNIQVQFHIFVDNCIERMYEIRKKLSKTHTCTYRYDFVWENWQLKK